MSKLPLVDPDQQNGFYIEYAMKLTLRERLSRRWWELKCWLKRRLVCSWRGHRPMEGIFDTWCDLCRHKLPGKPEVVRVAVFEMPKP